ncbi:hypothetical protein ACHAQA_000865 [Verticillium albo-atrum]
MSTQHSPDGTYESQQAWRDIQKYLPERLHFTADESPVEEWWEHDGYKIHLDRWRNPTAKVRLILHHGVGTNGRQLSLILGRPLHTAGFDLVAVDMPGYGCTQVPKGKVHAYDDWVRLASAFVDHELARDPRPVALYGLSAGGMLAYHVAAQNRNIHGVIGMTFLDQRVRQVADATAVNPVVGRVGGVFVRVAAKTPLHRLRLPMASVSKMSTLVNDPAALDVFLHDGTSAGAGASLRFLASYAAFRPAQEPEDFDVCPILLTQPADDRWTPLSLSQLFLERIKKVPVTVIELENAGHYPLEDPGLQQMVDAIVGFLNGLDDK